MRPITLHTGWTCRRLGEPGPGRPVRIPHDAMLAEPKSETAPGGANTGWYEGFDYLYENSLRPTAAQAAEQLILEFEGVYRKAEVWLNGEKLAFRPYGYTNFYVELTGRLKPGEDNLLEVIARNADQPNSRWYSGAGIYRPVVLWTAAPGGCILPDGVRVRTLSLDPPTVEITARTRGEGRLSAQVWDGEELLAEGEAANGAVRLALPSAQPWSPETPKLYTCRLRFGGDTHETAFGLRTLAWGPEGFLLNGERRLLLGACVHHDNGLLGAACLPDAVERKVRLLKETGYNAIRSAHNPCSKALLDACDRQGMLVMDEYIDHWYIHKTKFDYCEYFGDWWQQDLTDMVNKDYNHPCVVLYSTGNEVSETAQPRGIYLTKQMTEFLHGLDGTRPVTCGVNIFFNFLSSVGFGVYSDSKAEKEAARVEAARAKGKKAKEKAVGSQFFNNLAGLLGDEFMKRGATLHGCDVRTRGAFANLDIAGYNYGIYRYAHDLKKYPKRLVLGTETFCNDAYRFYEMAKDEPRIIGDFVWAGMDYLGEVMVGSWEYGDYAKRFDAGLGWVSAGSGRLDLTGKPLGEALYTRVALGREDGPYLAVCPVDHTSEKHSPSAWKMTNAMPSWSWRGCEGKKAEVEVYARAASVELTLNGQRIARKALKGDCRARFTVTYQNGTLEAVARDAAGNETGRTSLTTAGEATCLRAEPEAASVRPGHLAYIRLRLTGPEGTTKPMERALLSVQVEGGRLLGLGSACPYYELSYAGSVADTYFGEALAIVEAGESGSVRLHAAGEGLAASAEVAIQEVEA